MAEPGGTYDTIAAVYEFLVPDALLTPRAARRRSPRTWRRAPACSTAPAARARSPSASRCAATRSSPPTRARAMVARTQRLAAANGARVDASVCTWEALPERGWEGAFDVVFCVGNSLPHAVGRAGRRAALHAMAGCLRDGGRARRHLAHVGAGARRGLAPAGRRAARRARRPPRAADLRVDDPRELGRAAQLRRRGRARRRATARADPPRALRLLAVSRGPSCARICATPGWSRRGAAVPADKAGRYLVTARRARACLTDV